MIAGVLEVQLLANIARLQRDMDKAKAVVGSATAHIEQSVEKVRNAFGGILAGVSFVALIKGAIDTADKLRDVSKVTDMLVGDLAGLQLLANQTGTNFDAMTKGIAKMSVEMGKAPEKFRALGVTAKTNKEAFQQLADIFNLLPDINQRNALAQAVFSKSWAELAPALSEGSKKIAETIERGKVLSGITQEMTDRADEFNDKLAELKLEASGLSTRLAGDLLPVLITVADNFSVVRNVALTLIAVKVAPWAAAAAQSLYATVSANMAKSAATLAAANADVQAKAAAVALTTARMAEMRAAAVAASGEVALAIATNGLIPMQAKATAAAVAHTEALAVQAAAQRAASLTATAASGVLALMGGPIGAITLLLGLGATAWAVWGQSAKSSVETANDEITRGLEIAKRYKKEAAFGTGDAGQLEASLDAVNARIAVLSQSRGPAAANALAEMRAKADELQAALDRAGKSTGQLTDAQRKAEAAAKKFLDDQNKTKTVDPYVAIKKHADDYIKTLEKEFAQLGMTAVQKKMIEASLVAMTLKTNGERVAVMAAAAAWAQKTTDMELAAAAAAENNAAFDDAFERSEKERISVEEGIKGLRERVESIREEAFALNANSKEMREHNILLALEKSGLDKSSDAYAEMRRQLEEANAALANAETIKAARDQQVGFWQSVEGVAHQTWSSITDAGKDTWQRLKETGKNIFFDWLYQMTAKKWLINLSASVSGTAVAGQAFGATGGGSVGGGIGDIISGISNLFGSGAGSLGSMVGQGLISLGNAAGTAGQAIANFGVDMAAGQGFAGLLGQAIPYVGLALTAISLLMKKGGGPKTEGDTYVGVGDLRNYGGAYSGSDSGYTGGSADASLAAIGRSTAMAVDQILRAIGGTASQYAVHLGYNTDPRGTAPDNVTGGLIDRTTGQRVYSHTYDVGRGEAGTAMQDEVGRILLAAVRGADVAALFKDIASSVDLVTASAEEVQKALNELTAAAKLREAFVLIGRSADDVSVALIAAAGGIENLSAGVSSYYQNFYSEAERVDTATRQVNEAMTALGVTTLPATRDEFRALVEAQDLSTESGQQMFAGLMQLAPAYAAVTAEIEASNNAAQIASQRRQLEIDIMALSGDAVGALAAQRADELAAMDASLRGLQERKWALEDEAASAAAAAASAASAQEAYRNLEASQQAQAQANAAKAKQYQDLQLRIMELTGRGAEALAIRRAAELAVLPLGLRRLQERIFLLEDEAAAAARAAEIARQRTDLDIALMEAMGNAEGALAARRALALAALDPSLRALQEQLWRVQDAATAAAEAARLAAEAERLAAEAQAEAARVAEQIASQRYGLETRLLQLQGDTAALRARELAELDESNRALQLQIWALEDQRDAAAEAAAASQAASAAAAQAAADQLAAAEKMRAAWLSAAEGIIAEVRRIRGLAEPSPQSLATANAQFVLATAAARAGDLAAAERLPGLSSGLLDAVSANARTALDVRRARGRIAASLESTATGTVPATGNNADLLAELRALREEVAGLRRSSETTATATSRTTNILRNVTQDGGSLLTTAA